MPLDQGTVNVLDFGGSRNNVKQASNRAPPKSKGAQKMPSNQNQKKDGLLYKNSSGMANPNVQVPSLPATIGDVIMGPTPVPTTTLSMSGGGLSPYSYEAPATYTPPVPGVTNNKNTSPNKPQITDMTTEMSKNASKSKEEQFADFDKELTRIYTKNHPGKPKGQTDIEQTDADRTELQNSLLSKGYNPDYVAEYMYPLLNPPSYDNSVAPVTDPEISKRAFNYALDLWNKTDGTVYYDPNDPLFLQHRIENNRGPKNATEIAAELVNKGWSKEEADKATTAAYDEYQYQQSILIEETTQKSIAALSEQQNKMWGAVREATDQAYKMVVDG